MGERSVSSMGSLDIGWIGALPCTGPKKPRVSMRIGEAAPKVPSRGQQWRGGCLTGRAGRGEQLASRTIATEEQVFYNKLDLIYYFSPFLRSTCRFTNKHPVPNLHYLAIYRVSHQSGTIGEMTRSQNVFNMSSIKCYA